MLVPTIAFTWWLAITPLPDTTTGIAARAAAADSTNEDANQDTDGADDETRDEATSDDARGGTTATTATTSTTSATGAAAPATRDGVVWLDPSEATGERVPFHGLITPAIVRVAGSLLDLPMGAERAATMNGRRVVFVLEAHYHPPGFVGGPTGWHKGVTVYELR